jgi:RNA polymerase sigma factor for flagellar operon FliA
MDPAEKAGCELSAAERDELLLRYLPLVRRVSARLQERMPEGVNPEDLSTAGVAGLIAAVDEFDPARGVTLESFAEHKIRAAIFKDVGGLAWLSHEQLRRARIIERAILTLDQRLRHAPEEEDIAEELEITLAQYREWLTELRGLGVGGLGGEGGAELAHLSLTLPSGGTSYESERSRLARSLTNAVVRMPYLELTLLGLYYQEDLTLHDIAWLVNQSETRVTQLKTQAILRVRAWMRQRWLAHGAYWEEDASAGAS